MKWLPIDTMPDDAKSVMIFGKGYGCGDTEEQIEKEEPRPWFLSYCYRDNGKRYFASTEYYYESETWYVKATHWMPFPPAPEEEA